MEACYLIFINSLKSSIVTSFYSENAWFAAVSFGGYNLWAITLAAVLGSGIGNSFGFGVGYYLAKKREDWFVFSEALYARFSDANTYLMWVLLFPFSNVPFIGFIWGIYVVATGFFCKYPWRGIALIFAGRILFYGYYLHGEGIF